MAESIRKIGMDNAPAAYAGAQKRFNVGGDGWQGGDTAPSTRWFTPATPPAMFPCHA
jgi:hypothetical protein